MSKLSLLVACACIAVVMRTGTAADAVGPHDLGWLEGAWVGESDGVAMEEHWTSVAGGALLGMHRDVAERRMSSFEFLRIQTTPEGTFYFASPRSASPVAFKMIESSARSVVFENKAHDFPQRIRYELEPQDILHARVEGTINGQIVAEEWRWRRSCPCATVRKSAAARSHTSFAGTPPP
jgi:hypothetical protein